jgi:hypothetical protein
MAAFLSIAMLYMHITVGIEQVKSTAIEGATFDTS